MRWWILNLVVLVKSSDFPSQRNGKDLVYEAMKMRTGDWRTRDRDRVEAVGGGILEKKMLATSGVIHHDDGTRYESREMQCCDDLTIESYGEIRECHPYVIGDYRKIGSCGGRSFFQHRNNTDIFLYYACGSWYIGLEIGVCGGWILAKSTEICASARHQSSWKFFHNAILQVDQTFQILERCTFQDDFFPIPQKPTPHPQHWPQPQQHQRPQIISQQQPFPIIQQQQPPSIQTSQTSSLYPQSSSISTSVKHEHFHYHYPTKNNYHSSSSSSSGKHPNFNGFNGLGTVEFLQKEKSPTYAVQSQPLLIENSQQFSPESNQFSPYKHQYKGDPYKKRILDEDNNNNDQGGLHTYFPVQPRSDDDADHDDQFSILQMEEEEIAEDQVDDADKNSRKML